MYSTAPEAIPNIQAAHERVRRLLLPPPSIKPSEWAERNIFLRKGTTPRPGNLILEEYQREIVDVFADPEVHDIVCVKPTQIGWSVVLNILIGYTIDIDPKQMMMVQRTRDNAKDYGKKRLKPLIEDCAVVRAKIRPSKTKDSGNTLMLKEFPGGFLKLAGANAGSDLLSDPLQIILMDERDGYPADVQGEGEPGEVARNRTESFPDYKVLEGGTPAKVKDVSRLYKAWENSDQRRFHVHCPHCNHRQVLWWTDPVTKEHRLIWEVDSETKEVIKSSVRYICAGCGRGIDERYKWQMLKGGRWIAERPGRSVVGFHLNALYRPWKASWAALAKKWIAAQDDDELLKEFVTLQLGEWWEEKGESIEPKALMKRVEKYSGEVPERVAMLLIVVDTQDNRLEAAVWGFAAGDKPGNEEAWLIRTETFYGDPGSDPNVWSDMEALRLREFMRADGVRMRATAMGIDTQGHHTEAVYSYVRPRMRMGVFALRGEKILNGPVLVAEGKAADKSLPLYRISTEACKEMIMSRLRIPWGKGDGVTCPKYIHFNERYCDEEFFRQLTAEKRMKVKDKKTRREKVLWVKVHTRNEQLDLAVYAYAILWMLQNLHDQRAIFQDLNKLHQATKGEVRIQRPGVRVVSRGVAQ